MSLGGSPVALSGDLPTLDTNTLVVGRLDHLGWRVDAPTLAPQVMPYAGDSSMTGAGGLVWLNCDQGAPAGAYLSRIFCAPDLVTAVAIEVDEVQQQPSVGATSTLYLELWTADGLTRVSQTAITVGASAANATSGPITVTPGTEYQARIAGQASCLVGRVRVRPTTSTDPFWLAFVRLDPLGLLHTSETWGYSPFQPRFPRQDGLAEMRVRTTAASVRVGTWSNTELSLIAPHADFTVTAESARGRAVTAYDPPQERIGYTTCALPGGEARVIVRGGEATAALYTTSPQIRTTAIEGLYFAVGSVVEVESPPATRIAVVAGDSKIAGAGAKEPSKGSIATFLNAFGFQTVNAGYGGGVLASFAGSDLACEQSAFRARGAHYAAIQAARNDLVGNTSTAQSTIAGYSGNLGDKVHARGYARTIWVGITREQSANEALAFGASSKTWDDYRDAERALVSATGADSKARSAWSYHANADCCWTIAQAASGTRTADGTHPDTEGQRRVAAAISAQITGCELLPFPMTSLPNLLGWWEADGGAGGGGMGSVSSSGTSPPTVTLSGTAARGLYLMIRCVVSGARGTSQVQWSINGGTTWSPAVFTGASVALGATNITASFAAGTYSNDNVWTASSAVSSLTDLSGHGDLVQATTAFQPSWSQPLVAQRPGLTLVGTGGSPQYLHRAGLGGITAYTLGFCGSVTDTTAARIIFGGTTAISAPAVWYASGGGSVVINDGNAHQFSATVTGTAVHSIFITVDGAGNGAIFVDGVSAATGTTSRALSDLALGFDANSTLRGDGRYLAAFACSSVLGADEVRAAAGYWRVKYGAP